VVGYRQPQHDGLGMAGARETRAIDDKSTSMEGGVTEDGWGRGGASHEAGIIVTNRMEINRNVPAPLRRTAVSQRYLGPSKQKKKRGSNSGERNKKKRNKIWGVKEAWMLKRTLGE
jgi:hypothetical protein